LKNEVMNVAEAFNYLTEATAVSDIESFMVFGGEPMLYPERAIAIFQKAHQLGIPDIDMITNGVWGKNKETAEKYAARLKAAGLNNVDISVDAFHLPYIPLKYPQNTALVLLKAGIKNVKWNVAVIESIDAKNEHDKKTKEILKELEIRGVGTRILKIMPVGRAAQNLRQFFQHEPLHGPCEGNPILETNLKNPESICIEPSGAANICWNLSIGNAKQRPLSQLISQYDWHQNPTIKTLVEEGPTELLKLPQARDHKLEETYYINKCHLCIETRKTNAPKNVSTPL